MFLLSIYKRSLRSVRTDNTVDSDNYEEYNKNSHTLECNYKFRIKSRTYDYNQ